MLNLGTRWHERSASLRHTSLRLILSSPLCLGVSKYPLSPGFGTELFKVLKAVLMKTQVLWHTTPCQVPNSYQLSQELSASIFRVQCHIPQDESSVPCFSLQWKTKFHTHIISVPVFYKHSVEDPHVTMQRPNMGSVGLCLSGCDLQCKSFTRGRTSHHLGLQHSRVTCRPVVFTVNTLQQEVLGRT
jgi:hypothetical protein